MSEGSAEQPDLPFETFRVRLDIHEQAQDL